MENASLTSLDAGYPSPVRRLFNIGKPRELRNEKWLDYVADFGLSRADIPDLGRLLNDPSFNSMDPKDKGFWAPLHAWRALGQLQDEAGIPALLAYLKQSDGDDWADAELPEVFGMLGPPAIPGLAAAIESGDLNDMASLTVVGSLEQIGRCHPGSRTECIAVMTDVLRRQPPAKPSVNGSIISSLMDLAAVEAIDTIRDAFHREIVDLSIAGDIEDVEIGFGLRETRATPKPFYPLFPGHTPELAQSLRAKWEALESRRAPSASTTPKVGRNEPCPCGSGKKYKKCCLR